MREIFALDVGNAQTKLKSSLGTYTLLSSYIPKYAMGQQLSGLGVTGNKDIHTFISGLEDDEEYIWGQDIDTLSQKDSFVDTIGYKDRYTSEEFLKLVDFALGYLAKDYLDTSSLDIDLIIGLPTGDMQRDGYKEELPKLLGGVHNVTVDGIMYEINVKRTFIEGQSAGTLFNLTFDGDGNIRTMDYLSTYGVIDDFGGGTNLIDAYDQGYVTGDSVQKETGAHMFFSDLMKALNKDQRDVINRVDLQKAVKSGSREDGYVYYVNANTPIDISAYVNQEADRTTKMLVQRLTSVIKNLETADFVIFTGGGANLLNKEIIEKKLSRYNLKINFLVDPELANVEGFYKYVVAYRKNNQQQAEE